MDRPPTRLSVQIGFPGGPQYRWGLDEPNPANVPTNLSFSTTMPGGAEQMSCNLARRADADYPDLQEFGTVTVYGAGGEIAWQGRLETTPRTSGDQLSITPGAVGWQAHLDDEQNARMIYIDSDLTRWQPTTVQRKLNTISAWDEQDPTVVTDPSAGVPALQTALTGAWSRNAFSEAFYDAKSLPLGALNYAWKIGSTVNSADANWTWFACVSNDAEQSSIDSSGSLRAAGPGTGTRTATTATRTFAIVSQQYVGGAGISQEIYPVFWTYLAAIGNHGITIQGTLTATGGLGILASDVIQHAVNTWAPKLATSRNGITTIEPSTFIIPQLSFPDPTTVSNIITAATAYGLVDWWVDEGPTFNIASRENHGRDWRARVGPSGLQETGPQVDHLYNAVIVSFNDVTGRSRTVGPPGETVNTTDSSLQDTDPANPVNAAGLWRPYEYPNIGVSTPAGAIAVGQRFLLENKQRSTAGQAQIIGHVQDAAGVWWPSWAIRAGDRITFTDAHDPVPRRITRTQYSDSSRACQLDLDSPPQDLSQLLARYSIALTGLGV
jgi:hypothetical protein